MNINKAVILAAGEGRRLKPFTLNKPKAMLSVAGKPIIEYVIESLVANGIRRIIIVVGYQKEQLYDYFGDGHQVGVEIQYVTQSRQLGSAHALAQAKNAVEGDFLVVSGNHLISAETIARILETEAPAMLVKKMETPSRYGVVTFKDGKLTSITEKPARPESSYINAGLYTFSSDLFKYIESELTIPDAINRMLNEKIQLSVVETAGIWQNVIYPWDVLTLNSTLLKGLKSTQNGVIESGVFLKGEVSIGKDSLICSNTYIRGPVTIGKGCQIGPNVCISASSSIGNNVVIAPFSHIKNSVIGDDVVISGNAVIEDSVIDNGCKIGANLNVVSAETDIKVDDDYHQIKTGAMVGSGCRIGSLVLMRPGTIVGNTVQVNDMKMLSGNIPDRSIII
jgi:UDP-N-acetylglucosamine diphosphorylase/glucosamine-1-phosphate N-acetyltransferase